MALSGNTWLTINGSTSGVGNGTVTYNVGLDLNLLNKQEAFILTNHGAACKVTQHGLLSANGDAPLAFESRLDLPVASGQIVVNGQTALFQKQAFASHVGRVRDGANRIEAIVVAANGKPGTWRFELTSGYEPGSVVVVAGLGAVTGAGSVVFQVSGQPGQRFVFFFQGRTGRGHADADRE